MTLSYCINLFMKKVFIINLEVTNIKKAGKFLKEDVCMDPTKRLDYSSREYVKCEKAKMDVDRSPVLEASKSNIIIK